MGGFILIAIVAILVWGALQYNKQKSGQHSEIDQHQNQALFDAEQERDELRERVKVLERIVTDSNSPSALDKKKLAEKIEELRDDAQS